jgi:hypothetical protein
MKPLGQCGELPQVAADVSRRNLGWATCAPTHVGGYALSVVALSVSLLFAFPVLADDVITNVMSPVVSYQYLDALDEPGTVITSPIVSYQYFD